MLRALDEMGGYAYVRPKASHSASTWSDLTPFTPSRFELLWPPSDTSTECGR